MLLYAQAITIIFAGAKGRHSAVVERNGGARREERMSPKSPPCCEEQRARIGRREVLAGLAAATLIWPTNSAGAAETVSIGLNPLFLDSDIQLLSLLQTYLAAQSGEPFNS